MSSMRPIRSRTLSLLSIAEHSDENDDVSLSDQTAISSESPTMPSSSSPFTTPDVFLSDDGSPLVRRDLFSRALFAKLEDVASSSSSISTVSSKMYFSPGSNATSTPRRSSKKRRASSSFGSLGVIHKQRRIHAPQIKRTSTLSDDKELPAKTSRRLGLSRPGSLRRADSLRVSASDSVPTAPSTPPSERLPGVPVIAPPADFIPSQPLTARSRLAAYLKRELEWRGELRLERLQGDVHVWEAHLGLGQRSRGKVMEWIVGVHHDGCSSDEDSEEEFDDIYARGLADQLALPETRFHAAYLFLLFAYQKGWGDWYAWDMAVACVATSVKFHHDFLPPLLPIYSADLLRLAPHKMYYGDLEEAQRLLLRTLDYRIGGTTSPSGLIREIWDAVPGARESFSRKEWRLVIAEAWRVLLIVVGQPDVLQFPLSVLTSAAVIDASLTVLTWRSADEQDVEGLICDVEAMLQLRSADFERCRSWITEVIDASEGAPF
ncbi:hypothetical protein BDZ89DRAFT_1073879 [Hymenopellis radicata]|nr:hypothetical protein BDZ89DRAFT_1073879 [Hymenopellis radicata]